MITKKVYGYIRVSTVKQGTGVSLQEQKESIIRYAEKHQLEIIKWFEEQETAAKQGRPLFTKMMKLLQSKKANGVIIHKIDRSARNLKDWALLGDLIDKGVDVHFAHESLDLETRGGRLAADIQAVIASDYIRNLRQETLKGLYGRLKQGIYPLGAPIGYLDTGRGNVKAIDPVRGPLIQKAFHLYGSNKYSLDTLTNLLDKYGLKNTKGNSVSITTMSKILNNPFYAGVMKVNGKTFPGKHEPLVSPALFTEVQNILHGKTNSRFIKHEFLFRRLLKCSDCGYSMIGERQKGIAYYRCHVKTCSTKGIREDCVEKALLQTLEKISLYPVELEVLQELFKETQKNWSDTQKRLEESFRLQRGKVSQKLDRLTDALIENVIEAELFAAKKEGLQLELQELHQKMKDVSEKKEFVVRKSNRFLELIKSFKTLYISGNIEEKRKIIKCLTSNFSIHGKKPMITIKSPYYEISNRAGFSSCDPLRNTPRISTAENASLTTSAVQSVDKDNIRENMKSLLDVILTHFELPEDENQGV